MKRIGFVNEIKFKEFKQHVVANFDKLVAMYGCSLEDKSLTETERNDCLHQIMMDNRRPTKNSYECVFGNHFSDWAYHKETYYCYETVTDDKKRADYAKWLDNYLEGVQRGMNHFKELGGRVDVVLVTGRFCVVRYATSRFIAFPKEFVVYEEVKNYDNIAVGDALKRLEIEGSSSVANEVSTFVDNSATMCEAKAEQLRLRDELELAEKKAKEEYDLARKEMERQLQEMREKQEAMLSGLREQVEQMKDKIFVLELNILALRSLFGESFTLTQLSKGKKSDAPLVLYQKFRFLDEEFVRLGARFFGGFDGKHGSTTEIFRNKVVQDAFLLSDKCISFFRTSRDNKYYQYDREVDGLEEVEYYHGSQIGMLIRNGDNVWLSFIDEDIFVKDNLFESQSTFAENARRFESGNYSSKADLFVVGETKLRDPIAKEMFSRMMLFYVLNGLVQSTNIFEELKGEDLRKASDKVIFSSADNQITSSKYPSFKDYFEAWRNVDDRKNVKVGDPILIVERMAANLTSYANGRISENHRSRGYQNRARDAEDIKPGIATLSYIEVYDRWYKDLVDEAPYVSAEANGGVPIYYKTQVDESHKDEPNVSYEPTYLYYISVKRHPDEWMRRDSWGNTSSRINNVNLQVEDCDFCPISFINSNFVESWIMSKNIGGWYKGNYVYLVEKVFRTALVWCKKREEDELTLIRPLLPNWSNTPDELDAVLEWKKSNNVKNFTEWQAKRFVRWYKENRRA